MILKLKDPRLRGPIVARLQEALDLPVIDSVFGPQTENEVKAFQFSRQLKVDGIVGPATWTKIESELDSNPLDLNEGLIYDVSERREKPRLFEGFRLWAQIFGVVFHQTGCYLGENPERWARVNCHYGLTREGKVIKVNPETYFIWHAQGLSKYNIGIEVDGHYAGIEGNPNTVWKDGPSICNLSAGQIMGLELLKDHLKAQFLLNAAEWKNIFAHRQSSEDRRSDPGSEIWQVALSWAKDLNLDRDKFDGGCTYKKGTGSTIPKAWDIQRAGKY